MASESNDRYLFFMFDEAERLQSFKNWPFQEDCLCTPRQMAKAGFYHCPTDNEPDLVQCFMCRKELDGWEPDDDPLAEHKSHSKDCPFLQLKKPFDQCSVEDVVTMMQQIEIIRMRMVIDTQMSTFNARAKEGLERLKRLK